MGEVLYLDTARLGPMTPRAQRASHAFTEFAAREPASPRFDTLLSGGFSAWPSSVQSRYPGLSDWEGLRDLKRKLRSRVGCGPDVPVLLASRSSQLMRL